MSAEMGHPDLAGRKAFIVDTQSYVGHNGHTWVHLAIEDGIDAGGTSIFQSWEGLRRAWGDAGLRVVEGETP